MTLPEGLARLTGLKTQAECMPPTPVDPKACLGAGCPSHICQAAGAAPAGARSRCKPHMDHVPTHGNCSPGLNTGAETRLITEPKGNPRDGESISQSRVQPESSARNSRKQVRDGPLLLLLTSSSEDVTHSSE